jgi:hypothetical protein
MEDKMKAILTGMAAVAMIASAGYATAQTADTQGQGSNAAPQSNSQPGNYWGTDTDGKRVDVQAPYGGHNQAQADMKEAPVTEQLNEQALQASAPQR